MSAHDSTQQARLMLSEFERLAARIERLGLAERLLVMTAVVVPVALSIIGGQLAFAGRPGAVFFKAAGIVFLVSVLAAVPVRVMLSFARRAGRRHAELVSEEDLLGLGIEHGDVLGAYTVRREGGVLSATRRGGRWMYALRFAKVVLSVAVAFALGWLAWGAFFSGGSNRAVINTGLGAAGYAAAALVLVRVNDVISWSFDESAGTLDVTRLSFWFGKRRVRHVFSGTDSLELIERGVFWKRVVAVVRTDDGRLFPLPVPAIETVGEDGGVTLEGFLSYSRVLRVSRALGFELDRGEGRVEEGVTRG